MKNLLGNILQVTWRPLVYPVLGLVGAIIIVLPGISTLIPTTTLPEQRASLGIEHASNILNDPLFMPEKAAQYTFAFFNLGSGLFLRLVSFGFGLSALWFVYIIIRKWHTQRIALLSTAMLGTSTFFLQAARWATPDVMYLAALPALIVVGIWLQKKRYDKLLPVAIFIISMALYVPGLWIFVLLLIGINFRKLRITIQELPDTFKYISLGVFVAALTPLVYGLATHTDRVVPWLGLPDGGLGLRAIAHNVVAIPKELFVHGHSDPLVWLPGTPILDVVAILLMVLGVYAYIVAGELGGRLRILIALGLLACVGISLGGLVDIGLVIPLVYILVAGGLDYLLEQWLNVFPRNPVARSLGIVMVVVLVAASCMYQLTRYYIAYPNAPTTHQAIKENTK